MTAASFTGEKICTPPADASACVPRGGPGGGRQAPASGSGADGRASVRAERGHREDDKDAEADEEENCPVPRTPNGA